jgi:glutamyl-tRNA synthetase
MTVRVRIAPSPTGYVHVGNVRAALFNWLFARHNGGTFILRIDDTDVERSEQLYEDDIKQGFRWLGLDWDEGVDVGGPHGSYRQSDRFDHYRDVAHDLVRRGLAYYDDRTPDQLEALRQRAVAEKRHPNTYIRRPDSPASTGAIRFSVPSEAAVEFFDLVRDDMRFESETIDDFVILRTDGIPTYHLASTVDDVDYGITHVARGEDLLSSTPKHILLTRALGGEEPTYAHLPLLFGPDGKKLSKRHGDTSLKAYREGGYLPAAMLNFLATLGWSLDADRSIFTVDEAIAAFELSDVAKNSAVFDLGKLAWINGEYIRALPVEEFRAVIENPVTDGLGRRLSAEEWAMVEPLLPLIQERTKLLTDVAGQLAFLVSDQISYDQESWDKVMSREGVAAVLTESIERLESLDPFQVGPIEEALRAMLEHLGLGAAKGLQPVRVAVTGTAVSPPLFESIAALGEVRTIQRLRDSLARL